MTPNSAPDALVPMLAAGHVLRWRQDIPRLAPDAVAILFRRYLELAAPPGPVSVLDPCCGNGVVLAVLQVAFGSSVAELFGSDADPVALAITTGNLDLLNVPEALHRRIDALQQQREVTGNARLDEALRHARSLERLPRGARPPYRIARADALAIEGKAAAESEFPRVDLVLTDPPYGRDARWIDARTEDGSAGERSADERWRSFFAGITGRVRTGGWIAVAMDRDFDRDRLRSTLPIHAELAGEADLPKRRGYWIRCRPKEWPVTSG